MKLRPMADHIVLKAAAAEETTASGIILAAATKEKPAWFEVACAGPDCADIKAGDKVVIGNFVGTDLKLDGEEYKIVKLEEILAIVVE